MYQVRTEGLIDKNNKHILLIKDHITDINIAKAMARMNGLSWIATDLNGEVWGYTSQPYLDEDKIWQPHYIDDHVHNIIHIAVTNKPEDPEECLYKL